MLSERRELPQNLLGAVRRRFTELVYSWINFLHSLIVPNPQSLIANKDAEAFGENEKDGVFRLMAVLTKITRESTGFEAKKGQGKEEAKFISESFRTYLKAKKELESMNSKIVEHWEKEIKSQKA